MLLKHVTLVEEKKVYLFITSKHILRDLQKNSYSLTNCDLVLKNNSICWLFPQPANSKEEI